LCRRASRQDEYVCHAFPDDAYVTDQFFVALIGVAVALPVDMFLQHAFEVANEVDGAPESWLIWRGMWKMLLGKKAHSEWHFTDETRTHPTELAMFIIREDDPAWPDVVMFIVTWVPGRLLAMLKHVIGIKDSEGNEEEKEDEKSEGSSEESAGAEARRDRLMKRLYASFGLIGIYICWAIFSWFIFVYGMIIYKNLGPEAQNSFSQTWGVSYALDNCSEWQDVAIEACKVALILVILDLLRFTKDRPWFEVRASCVCMFV